MKDRHDGAYSFVPFVVVIQVSCVKVNGSRERSSMIQPGKPGGWLSQSGDGRFDVLAQDVHKNDSKFYGLLYAELGRFCLTSGTTRVISQGAVPKSSVRFFDGEKDGGEGLSGLCDAFIPV